ncbi:endolytic transglycosylase MltG [Georgenia sp. SYP-B2076]|uniref:endolytic transglycosylase MltG n=1 Tax=Georgenia sp. SYP-B2076 TaxID=2495881 RepID=UPI000F8C8876|nr:endolytic transglycosylase MltG [Georgenia sp. SYP-B2076]
MNDLFENVPPGGPDAAELPAEDPPRRGRREHRRAAEARRRRRRRRTGIVMTLTFVLVVAVVAFAVPNVRDLLSNRPSAAQDYPGPGSGEVSVVIGEGYTGNDMGVELEKQDVVASVRAFTKAFAENVNASRIQPGTYTLPQKIPARDAVAALLDPANKAEITITVPEGFHASQVYDRIANVAGVPLADVQAAAADPAAIALPAEAGGNPEGWLAAATYSFEPGDDAAAMLRTMVALTVSRLDERGVPADQRQAVLTKASIVEREVNLPEYYGQVARVIENRLADTGQVAGRLQMDSTVVYGLGRVGGVPSSAELADASNPYNTYTHPGLPPTPIGAPGTAAIDAVVHPPAGDWMYFVTVNFDTGETKFAATLAEHNANVAQLRASMRQGG